MVGAAARSARETAAEGIGLFRTELCFLNTDTEPTVDEQAEIYAQKLQAHHLLTSLEVVDA